MTTSRINVSNPTPEQVMEEVKRLVGWDGRPEVAEFGVIWPLWRVVRKLDDLVKQHEEQGNPGWLEFWRKLRALENASDEEVAAHWKTAPPSVMAAELHRCLFGELERRWVKAGPTPPPA